MKRWRANPTGVGSAAQLWVALDEEFIAPLKDILSGTVPCHNTHSAHSAMGLCREEKDQLGESTEELGITGNGANGSNDESKPTPRDIFMWWTYSPAWRSRRRVWYAVVHATATARDADWW